MNFYFVISFVFLVAAILNAIHLSRKKFSWVHFIAMILQLVAYMLYFVMGLDKYIAK